MSVRTKFTPLLIALLVLLAIVLRWYRLGRESVWFDEGMTWWLASLPPMEMLRVIRGDVAAPVYFWLLHAWQWFTGDNIVAARAFSALAGTLTFIPFGYLTRAVLQSSIAKCVAWGLFAVSFMGVQYAQEARYYALLALLATTALALLPVLASRRHWGAMVGYVLCAVVGLYTHNMMLFAITGLNVAWLVWPGERTLRQRMIDLVIANTTIAVLYLPWLPTLIEQTKWMTGAFWADRPGAMALGVTTAAISGVDVYAPPGAAWRILGITRITAEGVAAFVALELLFIIVLALSTRDSKHRRVVLALMSAALLPVLLVFIYSQLRQPVFMERVFIASSVVLPLLLAMAVDVGRAQPVRVIGGFAVGAIGLLGVVSTTGLLATERKEDWRGAYEFVSTMPASDRRVILFVANEGELPFAYYGSRDTQRLAEIRTGTPQGFFDLDPPKTIRRVTSDADLDHLKRLIASKKYDEIVLIQSHEAFSDPNGMTEAFLREHARVIDQRTLRLVRAIRFKL